MHTFTRGRLRGPYGETISRLMQELRGQIFSEENQKNGLWVTGPFMTLYHDSEYREKGAMKEYIAPVAGSIILRQFCERKTVSGVSDSKELNLEIVKIYGIVTGNWIPALLLTGNSREPS